MTDFEKKKISTTFKAAFFAFCGVCLAVWYVSGYANAVDRMKKHVDDHPKRIEKYEKIIAEQQVLNKIWELEMKAERESRKRLEKRFDRLLEHLDRLQLVAVKDSKTEEKVIDVR